MRLKPPSYARSGHCKRQSKFFFGPRGVEFFVGLAVVGFLINDEAFAAGVDHAPVFICFHRPDFEGDGRYERFEGG